MGTFIVFILKSSICLIAFYLCYKLLLSKDTFHRFNRIALLSLLLLSFVIPIGVMSLRQALHQEQEINVESIVMQTPSVEMVMSESAKPLAESTPFWLFVLIVTYLVGVVFFFSRQLWSFSRMFRLIRSSVKSKIEDGAILLVHTKPLAPFSWMKYIVISQKDLEENGSEILTHELAHIKNKHSWDLLVADFCIFFQWFNPAVWLLKQELKSIHEFEADEQVLHQGIDAKQYQLLLIKKAVGPRLYSMANSFNHSSLKKRITMMLKEKSNPWARLKYVYVLPLACLTMLAFAHPSVSSVEENTVEKVNNLLSFAPIEKAPSIIPSTDKINDNSTNAKTSGVKNTERPLDEGLLAVNGPQVTNRSILKSNIKDKPFFIITGKVIRASDKQPMSNVTVVELEPKANRVVGHTVSKVDGTFELKVENMNNKLSFVYLGYKRVNCTIKESLEISMEEEPLEIRATFINGTTHQSTQSSTTENSVSESIYRVEVMPKFPGGERALNDYILKNIKYPINASSMGAQGQVLCSCVISAQGSVVNVKVETPVDPELDKEAMRVIINMPDWIPGSQNGQKIPVKVIIPITFKLSR